MFTFLAAAALLSSAAIASCKLDSEEKSDPSVNKRAVAGAHEPEHIRPAKKVPVTTFGIEAYSQNIGKAGIAAA